MFVNKMSLRSCDNCLECGSSGVLSLRYRYIEYIQIFLFFLQVVAAAAALHSDCRSGWPRLISFALLLWLVISCLHVRSMR